MTTVPPGVRTLVGSSGGSVLPLPPPSRIRMYGDTWMACFEEPGEANPETGAGFADADAGALREGVHEASLLDTARQWEVAGLCELDSGRHPCG